MAETASDHPGWPLISIVIPTLNRLALLQEAISSVTIQTVSSWEVIVVDDCSTDGTSDWLQAGLDDPRIHMIRMEQHSERSAARNRGLSIAVGKLVLFLDDDDRLTPRALERMLRVLRRHEDAVAVLGARVEFDDMGQRSRASHPRRVLKSIIWPEVLAYWVVGPGQCLIRTSAVRSIGAWNESLIAGEDHDLLLRLTARLPVIVEPAVVLEHRIHRGQWRPSDTRQVTDEIRREWAAQLEGDNAVLALRILSARSLLQEAQEAQLVGDYRRSFINYMAAIRRAPMLFTSPLTRSTLLSSAAKVLFAAALGKNGGRAAQRIAAKVRQQLGRNPGATALRRVPTSAKRTPRADGEHISGDS